MPGPLRGPAGPSDGTDPSRVVMSSARITYNRISITACVLPHLVEASCIEAAKAAELAEDGRRITYLLKLYARKRGENGPPEPFQGVALRPQCNGMKTSLSWVLAKLGALRNYLGLERGASVWLVREALADGTVAVVVEPCDEQGCRGGAAGSEAVVLELRDEGVGGGRAGQGGKGRKGDGEGTSSSSGEEDGSSSSGEEDAASACKAGGKEGDTEGTHAVLDDCKEAERGAAAGAGPSGSVRPGGTAVVDHVPAAGRHVQCVTSALSCHAQWPV